MKWRSEPTTYLLNILDISPGFVVLEPKFGHFRQSGTHRNHLKWTLCIDHWLPTTLAVQPVPIIALHSMETHQSSGKYLRSSQDLSSWKSGQEKYIREQMSNEPINPGIGPRIRFAFFFWYVVPSLFFITNLYFCEILLDDSAKPCQEI